MTQGDTLVSNSYSKIVHTVFLQCLGDLDGTSTIGIGFHHTYQFGLWFQERTVIVEVIDHSIEVDLEDGLVDLLLQKFSDAVEAKRTGTLDEDNLVVKRTEQFAVKEVVGGGEKRFFAYEEEAGTGSDAGTYANDAADAALHTEGVDLGIEVGIRHAALEDVAKDEGETCH